MKVPKLRFPEFNDEWKEKKGKDIYEILGGASFKSKDSQIEGIKWLKIANVGINKIESKDISYLPIEYAKSYNKYLLKEEDIIIALTRPILNSKFKIALVDSYFNNSLLNQRVGKLIPKNTSINKFIYYLLQLATNIAYIENKISGTDPPNLSIKDLLNMDLLIPSSLEQEKIASFLSKVEEKIEKLEKKEGLWQTYKKGMMQHLFSQKLRFKAEDESDYHDWKLKTLEDISTNVMYGMNAAAKDFDGENKYIRITDISETNHKFVPNPLCSPDGYIEEKFLLRENDLVFARTGASTGKSYLYDKNDGKLFFAGFLIKFNINKANSKFIFYNTLLDKYKNWVEIMSVRSGQPGINAEEYKKLELLLPSIEEQTKIANFLTSIDKKIENINKEIEINKEFKKGLLQKIFPSDKKTDDVKTKDLSKLHDKQSKQTALL